jgi:hypothetical protein
MENLRVS